MQAMMNQFTFHDKPNSGPCDVCGFVGRKGVRRRALTGDEVFAYGKLKENPSEQF